MRAYMYLLLLSLLFGQIEPEIIIFVDDSPQSQVLKQDLMIEYCVSYPDCIDQETLRFYDYIKEEINNNCDIVHYTDFDKLRKYKVRLFDKYPVISLGKYSRPKHIELDDIIENSYQLLLLQSLIEDRDYNYKDELDKWRIKCNRYKLAKELSFSNEIIDFFLKNKIDYYQYIFMGTGDEVDIDSAVKDFGMRTDFPKRKPVDLPPPPIDPSIKPWEQNYTIHQLLVKIKP